MYGSEDDAAVVGQGMRQPERDKWNKWGQH